MSKVDFKKFCFYFSFTQPTITSCRVTILECGFAEVNTWVTLTYPSYQGTLICTFTTALSNGKTLSWKHMMIKRSSVELTKGKKASVALPHWLVLVSAAFIVLFNAFYKHIRDVRNSFRLPKFRGCHWELFASTPENSLWVVRKWTESCYYGTVGEKFVFTAPHYKKMVTFFVPNRPCSILELLGRVLDPSTRPPHSAPHLPLLPPNQRKFNPCVLGMLCPCLIPTKFQKIHFANISFLKWYLRSVVSTY